MEDIFELLDREWHLLHDSTRARRAFRAWQLHHPAFAAVASVNDAVRIARSAHRPKDRYTMTATLLEHAGKCPLAERALIQAQIPAMHDLSYRARGWSGERLKASYGLRTGMDASTVSRLVWTDLDAIVVAGAVEFIRLHAGQSLEYAGLKIRDHCRNRLRSFVWSELRRSNAESVIAREMTEPQTNPSAELLELLRRAREEDLLTVGELRMIVGNRLLGISDREFAKGALVSPATANRLRAQVEQRLAAAFAP